jgi:PAS domain S-box-containing protein
MRMTRKKNRELLNLFMIVTVTIIFSLLSLSIDFIDKVREYIPFYNIVPIDDFFINIIFLWLVVTLGITYQRWRGAVSERKELEDIISSINTDVLVVVDKSGTIIMCNDSVRGVFDYSVNEVMHQKIDLFYSKSDLCPTKKNEITEKLERDGFYIELATGRKKNGEIIPLEVVTYNRKNHDGAVLLLRDITERKKTEEKLEKYKKQLEALVEKRTAELTTKNKQLQDEVNVRKQSNEKLEKTRDYLDNIIDSSLDPVVIVDTTGCIARVNESLLKVLGYTEDEIIGKHTTEFSPSATGSYKSTTGRTIEITDDLIEQSKAMLAKLFEEGKVCNWERYFMRKDQNVVPVESNIVFLHDSEGNMTGGVGILRDITERKKAEEESNEARNFLENIFETTVDGIMVTDEQGCIVKINRAIEHMLGFGEDELAGKYTSELGPQDEERAKKRAVMFEQLFEKGYVKHWETEWFRKDGSLCPVEINITFLKDKEGNLVRAVAGVRDISGRRKAEESLRESEEQLRSLVQSASDGILTINSFGEITSWNSGAHAIFGYTPEEIIGKSFSCLVPERCRENNKQSMEKLVVTDKGGFVGKTFSFPGIKKDGSEFPAEISYASYETKEGMVLTGIVRDITERKMAEKELKENEEFLENLFKTAADGILVTDNKGVITVVNAATAHLLGYSQEEIVGKGANIFEPEGEEYEITSSEYMAKLFEEGMVTGFEFTWSKKDGKLIDVEVNAALLKDSKDNITGSVTSIRDITDRKQQEEKLKEAYDEMEVRVDERTAELQESNKHLQQEIRARESMEKALIEAKEVAETANRAKSEFLANMSHEFRTPLNHIIGFTELVVDKNFGDVNETQEEYLGDVLDSSKHLLLLINDILDLSKVEAGKLELEASGIDPRRLIDNSLIMFKEKSFKHGIELCSDVDHVPETIIADERKLKQILYNLLSNAVKFTPDGGKVCLSAKMVDCIVRPGLRSGDPENLQIIAGGNGVGEVNGKKLRKCVRFSVSDTGIGIKSEDQDRVFSPFEQVDGSSSRQYQGTGLGLSLTKKLVEVHGGKIWITSAGEGKGSTFNFIIPI